MEEDELKELKKLIAIKVENKFIDWLSKAEVEKIKKENNENNL